MKVLHKKEVLRRNHSLDYSKVLQFKKVARDQVRHECSMVSLYAFRYALTLSSV
jgi:hypothetical protein